MDKHVFLIISLSYASLSPSLDRVSPISLTITTPSSSIRKKDIRSTGQKWMNEWRRVFFLTMHDIMMVMRAAYIWVLNDKYRNHPVGQLTTHNMKIKLVKWRILVLCWWLPDWFSCFPGLDNNRSGWDFSIDDQDHLNLTVMLIVFSAWKLGDNGKGEAAGRKGWAGTSGGTNPHHISNQKYPT